METLEVVAVAAHGGMVLGHALGAIYNWREERPLYITIHLAAMVFSAAALINHVISSTEEK